ncbi:SIMPL domain-containing protein [Rhodococcus sp. Eu-32]|uniref:SIMPL domain-containing protein n=1 Tax=Rhodococcus sp. Eu-32 TaxID=1017319 RepID=UPI000DF40C9F|nr:SIMPL domain-containing protein [Rhodococcus sp. Eu-32]RRQ27505.1 SIMPL domain-containing protein [Rhodococcus sp. Eu-32]
MDSHPLEITVVGRGQATYTPERCTVSLVVRTDGRSAEAAAEPAHRLVKELTGLIDPLFNETSGPIDTWALDQVRHSRRRPFNQDGEQLPYVYQAVATIEVQFSQIDVIDAFVYAVSALDGVDVGRFDWALTEQSALEKTRFVRTLAVQDAVEKAEVYAQSVGRTAITARAIADPGLLGVAAATHSDYALASRAYVGGADDGFELKPQDIVIHAEVHARFSAS